MKYIKPLLYLALLVLLNACQMIPEQLTSKPEVTVTAEDGLVPEPELLENPYLSNTPSVPAMAKTRYQQALKALAAKDWTQAEFELQWLTEHYPNLSGPHLNLALLYQSIKQPEKARLEFQQAISANSNNVSAYNQYGIFLRQQGEFDQAERQYSQAIRVWPDYPEGHLNLAILYDLYMGAFDSALYHYERYQTLQSEPDREVKGWIIDTQRRLKKQQQELLNE
jgi:Tfp pilus assembly protein PilF